MQIKKFVASGLAALMAGATLAGAALAATQLGNVLNTIGQQAVSGTPYLVVVGANAAPSDVVGAIDVASAVAQQMYTQEQVPGVTTLSVQGKEVDNIEFGGNAINDNSYFGSELSKTQVPFLVREEKTYTNSSDSVKYTVEEKIIVPNAKVKTNVTSYLDLKKDDVNTKLEYRWIYEGSEPIVLNHTYTYPLEVNILGQKYYIIDTEASNKIVVMSGTVGMADASTAVSYGGYQVYVVDGGDDWAKIQIKDANGNVVKTDIVNKNTLYTYNDLGLKLKLLDVWASSVTNTVTGKLVVGSEVEKEIKSGDDFSDYWKWNITIHNDNEITKNDFIGVYYEPNETATEYLKPGETLKAPNDYFELGYSKNTIDQFVTLNIETGKIDVYNSPTDDDANMTSTPAILISANYPVFGNGDYSKIAIALDKENSNATYQYVWYVAYDTSADKYVKQGDWKNVTNHEETLDIEGLYDKMTFDILFTEGSNANFNITVGSSKVVQMSANYTYDSDDEKFVLGEPNEAEDSDVTFYITDGTVNGKWEDDATSAYGVVIKSIESNADNDKIVLNIPADQQTADIYIGKASSTTTSGATYNKIVPLTTTVAKLDSEITDTEKSNDNLILVGGPCVNSLVADLANSGKFDYTCDTWPAENFGMVKAIDDAFASGKLALVIAGTRAEDTRLATSVLSLGKLAGETSSSVKITGTTAAPTITPA